MNIIFAAADGTLPAIGTPFSLCLVYHTTSVGHTSVHLITAMIMMMITMIANVVNLFVLDSPLEEAFAGLAGEEAVVVAGHLGRCSQEKLIGKKVKVNF